VEQVKALQVFDGANEILGEQKILQERENERERRKKQRETSGLVVVCVLF
jgi:hypothetical protein